MIKKIILIAVYSFFFWNPAPAFADILPSPPTQDEFKEMVGKPTHRIQIPGLTYSELKPVDEGDAVYLYIPYIGEYIAVIYRYLIIAAAVIAVIMIIIAGLQWTASGGNSSTIESAKNRILGALVGLILSVGSYVILYSINPDLVAFRSLKIKYVDTVPIEDFFPHGDTPDGNDSYGGYEESNQTYNIPGTNETVKLSTLDVCYLKKLGSDQGNLNSKKTKVCLFGPEHCLYVHSFIASDLQKRFDKITASSNPEILKWKEHLLNRDEHPGPTCRKAKGEYCDPVSSSGSFSLFGHGSDRNFIENYGKQYGVTIDSRAGGIEVTAKANLVSKKMAEAGISSYTDKNGRTRKTKKLIKHWVAADKHSWGLGFDIDFPHNQTNSSINIPEAAASIITEGGLFKWGKDFNDPAHFEYIDNKKICEGIEFSTPDVRAPGGARNMQ